MGCSAWPADPSNVAFELALPDGPVAWVQGERAGDGGWSARRDPLGDYGQWGRFRMRAWATIGGTTAPVASGAVDFGPGAVETIVSSKGIQLEMRAEGWKEC